MDAIFIFSMCAVLTGGVIDCDEQWAVYVYEELDVFKYCYPDVRSFHYAVAGCATFDNERGHTIILGNKGQGKSHTGESLFTHEIHHLQCLCNYHANPPEPPKR
jgi:hypothetical protein